ncbi:hypothetical protein [Pseudescherichia sp.]|uniref:hypothetical protein n=1 Tax=Pseudescherichia sp. TaxID=2055881 RepID=UPI0028A191BC|nr:hypothetical protein [Pseudescherichia sp.]
MHEDFQLFTPLSMWPVIVYYSLSIAVFGIAYYGRIIVQRKSNYLFFILYTLVIVIMAAIQFCIFVHGTAFTRSVFHMDIDVDLYDSIKWGAIVFALLFFFAMPRNDFMRSVGRKRSRR